MSEKIPLTVSFISAFITGFALGYARQWRLALAMSSMLPCLAITGALIDIFIAKYTQCVLLVLCAIYPSYIFFPGFLFNTSLMVQTWLKKSFQLFAQLKRSALRTSWAVSTTFTSPSLLPSSSRPQCGSVVEWELSSSSCTPPMALHSISAPPSSSRVTVSTALFFLGPVR